ncbi:hypothetical protein [Micromonospora chokoriensis]|uniref:Uncharacterized protein n=1 Tax=Micromonospora chokoriensis TaxID=356851 RepID=A0A1C4WET0_9ACTN|nr:hypothetical protein [Micromonospora chokoriensis]SCE94708.1 hypothetical protein GA0070612_2405 [Micromonospora chokoriensis]
MDRLRAATLTVTALLATAGCTEGDAPPPPPSPAVSLSPDVPAVRLVETDQADLHLWVSNQSFTDDLVALTVSIDGTTIVDRLFAVEHQHNWVLFPVRVAPGEHVVRIVAGTGIEKQASFTMPETGRQYAAIDYGNAMDERQRHVNWFIRSTPIGFA